jgi:serine O-acetyltransferase
VRDLLRGDLQHMVETPGAGRAKRIAITIAKAVLYPRIRAVILYRVSQVCESNRLMPLAQWLEGRAISSSGAEIHPSARLGSGLCLMHSVGIVVGPQVTCGRNLRIYQGVTLGDGERPGQPRLGDDVTIGANAAVLGGVTIGDRVIVGANAVVTRDIPADSIAVGIPAVARPRTERHARHQRSATDPVA